MTSWVSMTHRWAVARWAWAVGFVRGSASLATQPIAPTGTAPTYVPAAADGDTFNTGDHVFLHVVNGNAAPCTVTIVTPATYKGFAVDDVIVAVPTDSFAFIGPLTDQLFRDPDVGVASVSYSVTDSVTVAVIEA